ncbi:DUF4265 domain-containing protein [Mucilaginibacter gotjawali]|uniref:Uncharacterized protein n=2 Tax=Mucilaginibacter gotjawali TaxID=1550579 RepID=A0A0X8X528_9SPHI|nr:DUF4265 domain-containing protein [Mucilaginibacter gotjawali]MBB3059035.1 hypothetical protein [Mucilaginibacter gotjawali]BAU55784.1 hypothetical protein MgSA37_03976 [Mucilaginibacter gotjawali]
MPDSSSVKILFNFFSDILDDYATETLLAEVVNEEYGYYKLKNLPFYVPKLALDDVVWAEFKQSEGMLVCRKTVQHSGNSTIQGILLNIEPDMDEILVTFKADGCVAEKLNDRYFTIAVPASVDYIPLKSKLDKLKREKVLDYAESSLSDKHQYKNMPSL